MFEFLTLSLLKLTLAPILLWQGKRTRAQTVKLPEPAGERNGLVGAELNQAHFKLLVIGDSSAAGVGAAHQSEALACQTAIALSQQLRRPVAWQLTALSGVNTAQALELFNRSSVVSADAALFSLGVNDASSQVNATTFVAHTAALLNAVQAKTGAKIAVFSGLPPVHNFPALPQPLRFYLGAWAKWLDGALKDWVAQESQLYCGIESTVAGASVADMASDGYHPGPVIYAAWGQQAASLIAAKVSAT